MAKENALLKNMRSTTCAANAFGGYDLTYHQTRVFSVIKSDAVKDQYVVTLNSGGYSTSTTKNRINWSLAKIGSGFRVFQKNHTWYISEYLGNGKHSEPIIFRDGMILHVNAASIAMPCGNGKSNGTGRGYYS